MLMMMFALADESKYSKYCDLCKYANLQTYNNLTQKKTCLIEYYMILLMDLKRFFFGGIQTVFSHHLLPIQSDL